jgi:nitrate/TMAO reductase-like tetraheme cytochrome c subunit
LDPVDIQLTGILALTAAALAAVIIVVYLVKKPVLDLTVKLWLLVGLGGLPLVSAATSTASGMTETTHRTFCGSCHVMQAHYGDASSPDSQSLAARHSRNPFFGDKSCYTCHADYGMYGYVMTKKAGMRHVYEYYLGGYRSMSLEEAKKKIHLLKPYDNTNCRQCHTTTVHDWRRVPDHGSLKAELDSNKVSCASAGCHGYAHPFTKHAKAEQGSTAPASSSVPAAPSASSAHPGEEAAP